MFGTVKRACLPWRNRFIGLFPRLSALVGGGVFSIRHLPRLVRQGWSAPLPPLLKRSFLKGIARDEQARVFVETGTYFGDTIWYLRDTFEQLHSIEVDPYLFAQASSRFRRMPSVVMHQGDSGSLLSGIVPSLSGKTMYWLDGHYSAGITGSGELHCPLLRELESIFVLTASPFVIAIDDARCFGTDPAYPTIDFLRERVAALSRSSVTISVENDVILIRQASGAN